MRYLRWFLSCVLVSAWHASPVAAAEPSFAVWAKKRLQLGLVQALNSGDTRASEFSRARRAPRERRVRILQASTSRDRLGRQFIAFAIDVRFGDSQWKTDDVVGCIYARTGATYVKKGDAYRPAAFLEGKRVDAVPDVCKADSTRV